MYKYYFCLGLYPIKHNEEGKYIHNKTFNNKPHFIKTACMLIVFKMVFLCPRKSNTSKNIIHYFYSWLYDTCEFLSKNKSIVNFTIDDMTSKFDLFPKNKMKNLYLTEIMQIYWMQMLDEYWDEKDTLYSNDFDFWTESLFQY